jgi:hypothetical protein
MLGKSLVTNYLKYAIAAAVLYCITVWIYISRDSFSEIWILYVGNFLFGAVIGIFIFRYNKTKVEKASSIGMLKAAHIAAIIGILLSCIIIFFLLLVFTDVFRSYPDTELQKAPSQLNGKTNGFITVLFLDALVGNFSTSSFVSIILPFTVTKAQQGEKETSKQL